MSPADLDDYVQPEDKARMRIDEMVERAGWVVQDYQAINFCAGTGVALRQNFTLKQNPLTRAVLHDFVDC